MNWCKKNNKVMYMISRSLQFVSCTVHRVFLMLSISSEVDYVPAIKLTTYGLELTFFFVCGGGVYNRVQDKLFFRLCTCAFVYMMCVCRYIV